MTPQHIPVREAAQTALAYYKRGHLGAQASVGAACVYRYRYGLPYRCAIGASLTDETLATILKQRRNSNRVGILIDKGIITTDDPIALADLQDAHDRWGQGGLEQAFLTIAKELAE